MRAKEFLREAEAAVQKKLGRAFNHLEDLVFFHGTAGTMEALEHIKEIATAEGSTSVRMKWDGNPQIYWGRERVGGPLILAGHNGWSKGYKTDSPSDIVDFITNKSGSPKTPEDKAARQEFANTFASLYPMFDAATPKDFVGFVYADGLFLQRPAVDAEGVYNFCPNPKSQTCYHVRADSALGKRIATAKAMVVGHAFFPEFGMDDSDQKPIDDFTQFNANQELIVQGPVYNSQPVQVADEEINAVEQYLQQHSREIDSFLQGAPGLGDLKNILYTYVNQTAKSKALDQMDVPHFFNWLKNSKVSTNKQAKIQELAERSQHALAAIFGLVKQIMDLKDAVIDQIEGGAQGEIWDTQGEGRVRYAPQGKQFGNVKLVPRKRWTPQ
jgi:hypothetical protein